MPEKYTNDLIKGTSPYLLQHAHNPVDWVEWSEEAFDHARAAGKLVLVSIGYSACHWCHVMERESFEEEEVAAVMNKHFVCIKVDREERPDVDQVYMTAVQLMTQRGGWPLNCFTLPDGRPIYGGTYFPKEQWVNILKNLVHTYINDKEKVLDYAQRLSEGVQQAELIDQPALNEGFDKEKLEELILRWKSRFDLNEGGNNRAPKFPLPNNYDFLLRYGFQTKDQSVLDFVHLSLEKMAKGGIYDQIGGGFARYAVDMLWKVPHFEKMLYDNAQLLTTFSNAYQQKKNPLYKKVVYQTVDWLEREMKSPEGGYFAALDADSEGEEGKFYTWTKKELEQVLGEDFEWVSEYYNINERGYWENGKYILLKRKNDTAFAKEKGWKVSELENKVDSVNEVLLRVRSKRVRPGLDDKRLTSWNAMILKGLVTAYEVFREDHFLLSAKKLGEWIKKYQVRSDYTLFHNRKKETSVIDGFLEDSAHVIDAFIAFYEATFDERWLFDVEKIAAKTIERFQNEKSKMFYFTEETSTLIARKMEINDNVIPSSNSVMANNLFKLGVYFRNDNYTSSAKQMLANIYDGMETYGSGYSNWANLLMNFTHPFFEIAIVGEETKKKKKEFNENFLPNILFAGGNNTNLPFLSDKVKSSQGSIFVCVDQTCKSPVNDVKEALKSVRGES